MKDENPKAGMNRSILFLPSLILVCAVIQTCALAAGQPGSLPAPVQASPADQMRLHGFPRTVVFSWSSVPGAKEYGIETDYYGGGQWTSQAGRPTFMARVRNPTFTYEFVGSQPGSWRVWAIDKHGHPGQVSSWFVFTFGPDNERIPLPPPDITPDFARLPAIVSVPISYGTMRSLPVFDPKTGEACHWPFTATAGISAPKVIYDPDPEPTEAARKARQSGGVQLAADIGEDGLVKRVCILRASRDDLGEQAIKTVRTWRFEPAKKDDMPVPYSVNIQVDFHIE